MKTLRCAVLLAVSIPAVLWAQPSVTIYNQNFAVVRDQVPLDLQQGVNMISYTGATAQLQPDSVILRDPAGQVSLRILNQTYRADTLSQGYLLSLNEGKTLDFIMHDKDGKEYTIKGKVIRSGYNPVITEPGTTASGNNTVALLTNSPIIEVDGGLRFSLPGEPVFPALGDDAILKPTLLWKIDAAAAAKLTAELSYLTNGLAWQAAYNLTGTEKGDTLDFVGWVTLQNNSGKEFKDASIQLMAGDVNRVQPPPTARGGARGGGAGGGGGFGGGPPVVTEQVFDEFHLYTLVEPVTLYDRQTTQVEFIRATGVKAKSIYVYDGAFSVASYRNNFLNGIRPTLDYASVTNKKVWVFREFVNSKENGLGIPLPKGNLRFYRSDDVNQHLEFTGENSLDHTPVDEAIRVYTGDSFDLVGERKRTNVVNGVGNTVRKESFEIDLRNHKKDAVEIRVVEHLRGPNWEVAEKSQDFEKTDSQTIEFRVPLKPDEEKTVTYRVTYST